VIGVLLPYTDPNLIKTDLREVGVSPFTLVFERAGLALAAGVMNAVILTAVLSAGNSGLYASTRMLYNLAVEGRAPAVFKRLSGHGVPVPALLATTAMGALCFLSSLGEGQTVYLWLLNLSGMTGFIAWLGIAISHYRFRRGLQVQGIDIAGLLPYQSPFFPWGPFFAFGMCLLVVLGQSFDALHGSGPVPWGDLIATYLGIPVFLAMWWGWRLVHGSRLVPYAEMHFPGALEHRRRPQ
jgi:lysine-specific permease